MSNARRVDSKDIPFWRGLSGSLVLAVEGVFFEPWEFVRLSARAGAWMSAERWEVRRLDALAELPAQVVR